jgi:two-component system, chemotaxis family, protein-glutamate methylesterase/glutaminase
MPRMDGMATLRHIVENFGIPTLMVSSLTQKDAGLTLQALEAGAFDFITKPQDAISVHIKDIGNEIIEKVKTAYDNSHRKSKMKKVRPMDDSQQSVTGRAGKDLFLGKSCDDVLAIGVSTGGPNALSCLLPHFPKDFPAALLVVQHMPAGFTDMFAKRLDAICQIEVTEAKDGALISAGRALIAPGDRHLKIKRNPLGTVAVLSNAPPVNGHRPSADVLFHSVAAEYGSHATGLIMTGMGSDGAAGIGAIMANGGLTVAQDEESCLVFGMPKAAIERKYIERIVSLEDMGGFFINLFMGKEREYGTVTQ